MHLMKHCRRGMTAAAVLLALAACSTPPTPATYAQELPVMDLQQYFNGTLDAHGIFQDRSGKVVKRFTVVMRASWAGETGTCLLYTSPSPRDQRGSRMPSSA